MSDGELLADVHVYECWFSVDGIRGGDSSDFWYFT